jgi:chemotaxis signal transduction protein
VVAAHGERLVGLRVDAVQGILEVPEERLAPLPVGDEPLLAGIAELDGALVVAIDVAALAAEVAATRPGPQE